jgi:hypothetical protein
MGLTQTDRAKLISAVDRTSALKGAAIAFVGPGSCELVRKAAVGVGSKLVVTFEVHKPENPHPRQTSPERKSRLSSELLQMGLSCGSTALWAVGTIFFAASAAPTGGAAGVASYATGVATVASGLQCMASGYRVYNEVSGNFEQNAELDRSWAYQGTILSLDAVQVAAGVGVTLPLARRTAATFARSGTSLTQLAQGEKLSRPMRRAITTALGNPENAKHIQALALTARARQEFLNILGTGLDLSGSATGGVVNELVVWISESN